MNTTEQLQFIVDLANKDLANIREGDLINLQDDFERFFEMSDKERMTPGTIHYNPPKTGQRYPAKNFPAIQTELKTLLRNALLPAWTALVDGESILKPTDIKIQRIFIPGGTIVYVGNHRDLFSLKLGYLLQNPKLLTNVRQCEPCGKFFFRVRRQKYCSRQCTLRTNKKAYLDSLREKANLKKKRGRK